MQSRRERVRQAAIEEIKTIAWETANAEGLEHVTINGIARRMGMTPPAFYSYFKSRDDLIRALILEAYQSYYDALAMARDSVPESDTAERFYRVYMAYREWCINNPSMFSLFTGRPVYGFENRDPDVLQEAERVYGIFIQLYEDGWQKGVIKVIPEDPDLPASFLKEIYKARMEQELSLPTGLFQRLLNNAFFFHGMISMEISRRFSDSDMDNFSFYQYQVISMIRKLGMDYTPESAA